MSIAFLHESNLIPITKSHRLERVFKIAEHIISEQTPGGERHPPEKMAIYPVLYSQ